jgi:acyl-CoA synthetase (AMP-forming)/AMP-acid ligase II
MWFLDSWMTYGELRKKVAALAASLPRRGFRKGAVLALILPNSFQYVIAY